MVIAGVRYSRNRLARETGYSLTYASYIFSGRRVPSARGLRRIAKRLGVTPMDVVKALPRARDRKVATERLAPKKWVKVIIRKPATAAPSQLTSSQASSRIASPSQRVLVPATL